MDTIDYKLIFTYLNLRSPFVDSPMIFKNVEAEEFFDRMEKLPSPRVIKVRPNIFRVSQKKGQ